MTDWGFEPNTMIISVRTYVDLQVHSLWPARWQVFHRMFMRFALLAYERAKDRANPECDE